MPEKINEAEIVQQKKRKLAAMKATVAGHALEVAAKSTGLPPKAIIAWERALALMSLAHSGVKKGVMVKAG